MTAPTRFPIRVERRYAWILRLLFGVRADNAYVDLDDDLDARFGRFRCTTATSNIVRWSIEGPWLAITALGVRRSNRHGDITFGGSRHGGVRVDFREPPRLSIFHPPAIYLTVDDLDAFAAALAARGIPGEDRRER
ncbi:MAG TPA: hypothetical protein VHR16_02065 [Candidatus Limnocylindrales bacterium]|nr:hypothetical protein [Candidatus Limnocylindrales bacterium]